MNKLILILLLSLAAVGCTQKNVKTDPVIVQDFVIVDPDPIKPVTMDRPQWMVWNRSQLSVQAVNPDNENEVFYVLSQEEFKKLVDNLIQVSDTLGKSFKTNQYYQKAINDYRAKKAKTNAATKATN